MQKTHNLVEVELLKLPDISDLHICPQGMPSAHIYLFAHLHIVILHYFYAT
jgi:hypothetical protein